MPALSRVGMVEALRMGNSGKQPSAIRRKLLRRGIRSLSRLHRADHVRECQRGYVIGHNALDLLCVRRRFGIQRFPAVPPALLLGIGIMANSGGRSSRRTVSDKSFPCWMCAQRCVQVSLPGGAPECKSRGVSSLNNARLHLPPYLLTHRRRVFATGYSVRSAPRLLSPAPSFLALSTLFLAYVSVGIWSWQADS